MLLLCLVLCVLSLHAAQQAEFGNFIDIIDRSYLERVKPEIGRQADPCRVQMLTGRFGATPNSANKILTEIQNIADTLETKGVSGSNPQAMKNMCLEALQHSRNWGVNVKLCGQALAHYRVRQKETPGRSSGTSAWDELYGDLSDSLTEDEILEGLNLWGWATLGILIDNTGSMSNDIDQVTRVVENFLDSTLYYDNTIDNFVIMSFGDPDYEEPTSYYEPTQAVRHIDGRIVASMGGDCPEMTCQALEQMISYTEFATDSPIFIFTDASSKDCDKGIVETLEDYAITFGDTFNFVLTGICGDAIDANFTRLATQTGGSIYRIDESEIYDLTDIITSSTESSSVIASETSDYYDDYWDYRRKKRDTDAAEEEGGEDGLLMRRRRQAGYSTLSFYVDETVGRLTIQVTFEELADRRLLEAVTMDPRVAQCSNTVGGSRFGNIVYYAIDCPCVGEWVLKIPYSISNKWTFSARTFGEYSIGFDVMFEQVSDSGYNEKIKEPCAGDMSKVWITLYQDESIDDDVGVNIILTGKSYEQLYRLTKNRSGSGNWSTRMVVPSVPFSVAVRGTTVEGNVFLRLLNTQIQPTTTCLKTERISPNHMTIKAGGETSIIMSLKSTQEPTPKRYDLYCLNDRRRDGFETTISRPVARYHEVQELDRYYYIYIKVKAPPIVDVGEIVNVKCYARAGHDKVYKTYTLMVSSVYS